MIKIVVAYDDNDSALADYFEESYKNILQSIQSTQETQTVVLRGLDCTEANVNSAVVPLNANPFLFIGFSHGDELGLCLLTDNDVFVSENNAMNFGNSFFYTTACNVASRLGITLLANNCRCFIGCEWSSLATFDDFYDVYIDCENFALREFLNTTKTIQQTFDEMMLRFDGMIDKYSNDGEVLFAMELQNNKDCMILLGDGSFRKQDFHLN
ncbi:MAG: hypothetical protein U0T84_12725 [Chitinophagales bacterium]